MKMKLSGVAAALMLFAFVSPTYSDPVVVSFTYSGGSFTSLPVPPGGTDQNPFGLNAFGINNAGQIVGRYNGGGNEKGFLYSGGTYTPLAVPGFTDTTAYGISNITGQIVGSALTGNYGNYQGFLYSGGTYSPIAVPGATNTFPYGINSTGQIVGSYSIVPGADFNAFLYSGGTYTPLAVPGATGTIAAYGINDAGQVVGIYSSSGTAHMFLYDGGSYTTLPDPFGSTAFDPFGINNKGQITGYFAGPSCSSRFPNPSLVSGGDCGFLYDSATMTYMAILYPGYQFTYANGINDAGLIAGYAHTILPTPLPASLPLFASGLGALGLLGWRRKNAAAG
jgi:probable HAF family extracellular repeat protein